MEDLSVGEITGSQRLARARFLIQTPILATLWNSFGRQWK
jgi:hypothetical protein